MTADRNGLGFLGFIFGGVTAAVMLMACTMVIGHVEGRFVIETPLMWIDKAATWKMAEELGGEPLLRIITEHTHSCYKGERARRHDWGYGCDACPACELRSRGYHRYKSVRRA